MLRIKTLALLTCLTMVCGLCSGFWGIRTGQAAAPTPENPAPIIQLEGYGKGPKDDKKNSKRNGKKNGKKDAKGKKVTVSDVRKEYKPEFLDLQEEYEDKLNSLIEQGLAEYHYYKQNNLNPPLGKLVFKYLRAGNRMEAECDREFEALTRQMRQELSLNNLPKNLVKAAENEYEREKLRQKKQLLRNGYKYIDYK